MKVLIAEDNALWRKTLERSVTNWGFEPVLAENGKKAFELLQRDDAPRLAILDWQMPEMDGIDVCRRVKQDDERPFTYVVMLSARDEKEDMINGLDAGADDYLTKPVDPAILRSRLTAARRIVQVIPPKEWSIPRVPGYDVDQLLGRGAFATVWQATQQQSERVVALKIIRMDLATEEIFDRFAREIRLTQQLDHPNIAHVYDSHIDKKLSFYAMELIDGSTLDKFVYRDKPKAAKLLRLAATVGDALDHAHQREIIHRDLKPSNIMVERDGTPKLLDFGLARNMFRADDESDVRQSMDGSVIGTPLFMAPEQARGENAQLDGRCDVYALGIIVYMMLLRKHPHQVQELSQWETIREIAEGYVRPPSEVKPEFNKVLEQIIMRSLARDREDRYPTAAAFAAALRKFVDDRVAAWRAQQKKQKP